LERLGVASQDLTKRKRNLMAAVDDAIANGTKHNLSVTVRLQSRSDSFTRCP